MIGCIGSGKMCAFHLKMQVDIPEQYILYITILKEVLKEGWAKYLYFIVLHQSNMIVERGVFNESRCIDLINTFIAC